MKLIASVAFALDIILVVFVVALVVWFLWETR